MADAKRKRRKAVARPAARTTRRGNGAPRVAPPRAARAASSAGSRRLREDEELLVADVGNSETTLGLFRGDTLAGFWRLTTQRQTADELTLSLEGVLRGKRAGPGSLRGGIVSSVVPALTHVWTEALERVTRTPTVEVSPETTDLAIRVHDKASVGADRLANAIAARALYGTPAIVVDLGTATTFDCISREGSYLGGIIAPGLATSTEELFRKAARLSRVELRKPDRAIGRTTEEALRAGAIWGHAGQVDALVRRIALEMKGTPHVIATGGYAKLIAPECETINRVDDALTLKGMVIIWLSQ